MSDPSSSPEKRARSGQRARVKSAEKSATDTEDQTSNTGQKTEVCPECDGRVRTTDGERICESCGLVIDETVIDQGPEWRAFNHQEHEDRSRVGAPSTKLRHDDGLTTTIDWKDKDSYGNTLSSQKRQQMHRLRKWDKRVKREGGERNLAQANGEIKRMGSALGLPSDIRETAAVLYRRAHNEDLVPGRSIEGVATACLYAAARQHGAPRSLDEMRAVSRVGQKEIQRTYRYLARELSLDLEPVAPKKYVPRFISSLEDATRETEQKALAFARAAQQTALTSGKDPTVVAAAAIYCAALTVGPKLTQREIAEVADVTKVSIRNRYQEIIELESDDAVDTSIEALDDDLDAFEVNQTDQSSTTDSSNVSDQSSSTSDENTNDKDREQDNSGETIKKQTPDETSSKEAPATHNNPRKPDDDSTEGNESVSVHERLQPEHGYDMTTKILRAASEEEEEEKKETTDTSSQTDGNCEDTTTPTQNASVRNSREILEEALSQFDVPETTATWARTILLEALSGGGAKSTPGTAAGSALYAAAQLTDTDADDFTQYEVAEAVGEPQSRISQQYREYLNGLAEKTAAATSTN